MAEDKRPGLPGEIAMKTCPDCGAPMHEINRFFGDSPFGDDDQVQLECEDCELTIWAPAEGSDQADIPQPAN